ncbi:hypothetical protein PsorP6_004161 [Peronosclerospora sorghi]|uniref:Uncharacterized protein n=1 Tax=Peronosclerospora sorghi TaxID=230839 RepID=A0ACC0VMI6_9STRA|nr:hypothetical protein PsorP6_004161 [Peronosclerospora sorghi]
MARRAVHVATTIPSSIRSLSTISHFLNRSNNLPMFQRLPFAFCSHRTTQLNAPYLRLHFNSSPSHEKTEHNSKRGMKFPNKSTNEVYSAPMSRAVRIMKAVSVTSCTLTTIGMPVLCVISEQDTSTIGKWAMCGTIMLFGLGTTSLFHYLFKPYVIRMWLSTPSRDEFKQDAVDDPIVTVETVTLFARLMQSSFRLSEVLPPSQKMHPMVSFQAHDRHYFIHPEAFEDQKLLTKLVGANKRK